MKTITIIELLVDIANGKEVPEKIKWEDTIYVYSKYDKDYIEFPISVDEYKGLFNMKDSILTQYLNDELEIIEDNKIEKLGITYLKDDDRNKIIDKINEIIDKINGEE